MQPEQVIPPLVVPSDVWVKLFVLVSCGLFVGCLYHAIKMGIVEYRQSRDLDDPPLGQFFAATLQVLILTSFVLAYWLLESMTRGGAPYFVYSLKFPDGIPLLLDPKCMGEPCSQFVRALFLKEPRYNEIPLSVLLMETSLTYSAMWTALALQKKKIRVQYVLAPLWGALSLILLDALLDPVVGVTYNCEGLEPSSGVGLWHWFVPDTSAKYPLAHWFGVPLFNYAAWWTGPVVLISGALILQWFRLRVFRGLRNQAYQRWRPKSVRARKLAIVETAPYRPVAHAVLLMSAYFAWLLMIAPNQFLREFSIWAQSAMFVPFILIPAAWVATQASSFQTNLKPDLKLTLPPLLFLGLAALGLFIEGIFLEESGFIFVGLLSFVLVLLFTVWPYQKTLRRVARRLSDLDRFTRIAYYGFPAMMVLLGGFAVGLEREVEGGPIKPDAIQKWHVGGLLVVALAFHIFAYVSNDLIDLDIDVGQRKRWRDPLVRYVRNKRRTGISQTTALAIALVQLPVAFLAAFLLEATCLAYAVLGGGFLLMTAYNVFGKWCADPKGFRRRLFPWTKKNAPLMTDFIQALAWGSLAFFGALIVDRECESDNWILVCAVFSFGAGFILLINGIHGGLRDLKNDQEKGCETTAIWLGATKEEKDEKAENGVVLSNWKIQAFAFTVHTLMFALPFWTAARELELSPEESEEVVRRLAVFFVASSYCLYWVVHRREPKRDWWTSLHAIVILQTPLFAFQPFVGWTLFFIVFVSFWGSLLTNERTLKCILRFTHPKLKLYPDRPPPCPKTC